MKRQRDLALLIFLCMLATSRLRAGEYRVSSAAELSALSLKAGDKVILTGTQWNDQQLVFSGNGTEARPILLTTEKPGSIRLTGHSNIKIEGSWLVVNGLYFTGGYSLKGDVVLFSDSSLHCRLTNSAVVDYNPPDDKMKYVWVSVHGHYNRVDHCWLQGKTHQDPSLVIWLDAAPTHDRIDHNYFGHRPPLGRNGGETIRVGNSTWSLHDSYTTVEKNIFDHCDGEVEVISNKSCHNTIRDNLFYECHGTLTLRHGNDADVYHNYFIGNNQPGTGGIRVIAEDHDVHDNYFQDLTGTGWYAAISIMDGLPNPPLTGHWQVKNARIRHNLIVNCKGPLCIGVGKNEQRYLPALNTTFADNIIVTRAPAVEWVDESVHLQFARDTVWHATDADSLPSGFIVEDPHLKKAANGLYYVAGQQPPHPFWMEEKAGPDWMVQKRSFGIR